MSSSDILGKMAPYLDPHMLYNALQFQAEVNKEDVSAQLQALEKKLHFYSDSSEEAKKALDAIEDAEELASPVLNGKWFDRREGQLRCTLEFRARVDYTKPPHATESVTAATLEKTLAVAKLYYENRQYSNAAEVLRCLSQVVPVFTSKPSHIIWGVFAANIMAKNWRSMSSNIEDIMRAIDQQQNTATAALWREWLLHWMLFAAFAPGERAAIPWKYVDLVLKPVGESESLLPYYYLLEKHQHLIRYVILAAILSNKKLDTKSMAELFSSFQYKDKVTDFITKLYLEYDFEGAARLIPEVEALLEKDFFVREIKSKIVTALYETVIELHIRTHKITKIEYISSLLGLSPAEGELWASALMAKAGLNAKIDSVKLEIEMTSSTRDIYERTLYNLNK